MIRQPNPTSRFQPTSHSQRGGFNPSRESRDTHRPANKFAGYLYKVRLRGLGGQSTKVDSVASSARLQSQRGPLHAFTLIELLIVIAIVLILIAIALPNFLEAQVRAKYAKVQGDFRAIHTAVESYRIDFNKYPPVVDHFSQAFMERLLPITTPINYIGELPRDPFGRGDNYGGASEQAPYPGDIYMYNTGVVTFGGGGADPDSPLQERYSLHSGGPDGEIDFPYYAFNDNFILNQRYLVFVFSPTNGTKSRGDIIKRGGEIPNPQPGFGS